MASAFDFQPAPEPVTEPTRPVEEAPKKLRRGFAVIDPERRREISSRGGKAAHATGHAHKFTQEQAREAGRKGGMASRRAVRKKNVENPPAE